jgi:hypothetical protein
MPVLAQVALGPLPAGTYTYEVYEDAGDTEPPTFLSQRSIVVAATAPAVPTVSSFSVFMLTTMFAAAGAFFVARLR